MSRNLAPSNVEESSVFVLGRVHPDSPDFQRHIHKQYQYWFNSGKVSDKVNTGALCGRRNKFLKIVKLFLEESGDFTVRTYSHVSDALKALSSENFDVIISDYQMPEMDGIDSSRR